MSPYALLGLAAVLLLAVGLVLVAVDEVRLLNQPDDQEDDDQWP